MSTPRGRGRLPIGVRTVGPEERLSIVEHLDELRRRIIISLAALVVAFSVAYVFRNPLIRFLQSPLPDNGEQDRVLITLSPTEPFFTVMKVCFACALIAALPIWLYQLYAFVMPAIGRQSRRVMLIVVAGVASLFTAGVAFGYFVVLPVALRFLLDFGDDLFATQVRAGDYYSFVTAMLLASGAIFEVPVAMLAFARLGVVTADIYRRQWRIALVAIAAIAAILPGGDPFSMFLLMIPQILLYVVGIWLAQTFGGKPLWDKELWSTASEQPDPPAAPSQ